MSTPTLKSRPSGRGSVTDISSAAYGAIPPSSYGDALSSLIAAENGPPPPLAKISDEALLTLAKEILSNFYERKHEWNGGEWASHEAELLGLAGAAAEFNKSASSFIMASSVSDYLCTCVEALEYKLGKNEKQPDLLSKKRAHVMDDGTEAEVYGPVPLGALYAGSTFDVWTSPAGTENEHDEADRSEDSGKVCIVLGAGNQSFLTLVDVLDNVLRHKRPVLVKHHPLRPWLSEPYGIILDPLSKRGYFAQVQDLSIAETKALLLDPAVGHVHVTGALKTSQAIHEALQQAHPDFSGDKIKSMITSELGCATPQVVDDGVYTEQEIQHLCQTIAFGKKNSGGCNCLSAQVVVLPKHWLQKDIFRSKLFEELKRQPTTPCYYPGSLERKAHIVDECKLVGSKCTTVIAPPVSKETKVGEADQVTIVECGTPGEEGYDPKPLISEAFGPVLAIVELAHEDGDSGDDEYLAKTAVPFLNNKDNIFGSLSCSIFTPVSKNKDYDRASLQSVLATLQYGAIGVNQPNLLGYTTATKGGIWGGHPLEKLGQSGNGHIGDLYGIVGNSKNAKAVVYGPSLEKKPMFDLATNPPAIVFDVLMELTCTPSLSSGVMGALKMLLWRSVHGILSYVAVPMKTAKRFLIDSTSDDRKSISV